MTPALAESVALHERVRRYARAALEGRPEQDVFETLALDIARFQIEHNPVLRRLGAAAPQLRSAWELPALPADVFRMGRVAAHDGASDVARFHTSGTTAGPGVHVFRTLDTYRELSLAWGRRALRLAADRRYTVVALAEPFEPLRRSSLGYMMQEFMRDFDGRALAAEAAFNPEEAGRWLVSARGVDVTGLNSAIESARRRTEPLLLLGTSYAFAWLIEELGGARRELPPGSVIMQTGGFKGRVSNIDGAGLTLALARTLAVPATNIIAEYGMTELSSQLYDNGFDVAQGGGRFTPPPWLRVQAVDPVSFAALPDGEVGLAQFTDLGNVDSALHVLTRDLIRCEADGIALLGRQAGSSLRGCSLAVEALRSPSLAEPAPNLAGGAP